MNKILRRIEWLVGLVLLQALILNNVHIAGYATPFLYVYFIMKLESGVSRNELMLWAAGIGLAVDIFSDTPGMHMAATVLLAFVRPYVLGWFLSHDTVESITPSVQTMGPNPFLKYAATGVVIHHTALMLVEFLSVAHPLLLLLRIVSGSLLTLACIAAIEGILKKK